jgi:alpha-amylase/alpha-mannosidase (GH57 family)
MPFYRDLSRRGIELSLSPYYHPILPLLCDTRSAREALPDVPLPKEHFAFPADANEQIVGAQQRFTEFFGHEAQGMWPSEGSISDAVLAMARSAGLRWLASDEGVLLQSLQKMGRAGGSLSPEQKYSVHRWGDGEAGPCLFFRDHALSDLIGFTYASWRAEDASADFVRHLRSIHESLPDDGTGYVVSVILDGENAWDHYPENGAPFLRSLYRDIKGSPELKPVTFAEFLDLERHRAPLPSLVAGSWIYGNFATWVGHPEKNRGWEFLSQARRCLGASSSEGIPIERMKRARREMMIAEGSDWFWWYGDDHQTENAAEFDTLFRGHVKNVYRFLAKKYPTELDTPINQGGVQAQYQNPVHTMTPRLDGKVSDYFEWLSAGFARPGAGESMHRSRRHLDKLFFGYDVRNLYLRLDLVFLRQETPAGLSLRLQFASPAECYIGLAPDKDGTWKGTIAGATLEGSAVKVAVDKIVELGIPLDTLGIHSSSEVRFSLSVLEGDHEVERFPSNGFLTVPVDPWGLDQREWFV